MSYVDDLVVAYSKFVALLWQQNLAPPQRVWMAVYLPEHARRLRLHLPAFKAATNEHHHLWALVDVTKSFETWMAAHDYRDAYFEDRELLETHCRRSSTTLSPTRGRSSPLARPAASSLCSAPGPCSASATP